MWYCYHFVCACLYVCLNDYVAIITDILQLSIQFVMRWLNTLNTDIIFQLSMHFVMRWLNTDFICQLCNEMTQYTQYRYLPTFHTLCNETTQYRFHLPTLLTPCNEMTQYTQCRYHLPTFHTLCNETTQCRYHLPTFHTLCNETAQYTQYRYIILRLSTYLVKRWLNTLNADIIFQLFMHFVKRWLNNSIKISSSNFPYTL